MQKFAIGQAVRRFEDERFVTGAGRYIDDIMLPGMLYAVFVRSPFGHAKITELDVSTARQAPGVIKVYTNKDVLAAGLGPLPTLTEIDGVDENGVAHPPRHALTGGIVRYVGDPIAMVVAATRAQARDAAEMIIADYEDLPCVSDTATALDAQTPVIWDELGTNRVYHFHKGDEAATDAALAASDHVIELDLINNRVAPSAVEPRGSIGDFDAEKAQYILHVSGQAVHGQQAQLANAVFKVPLEEVRVVMPDVGGGFGAKNFVYPENVMVMLAAKEIGRPVKWIAERAENFISEIHGRDHFTRAKLGVNNDGRLTALKVETLANMGAYMSSYAGIIPTSASWVAMGGNYDIAEVSMTVDAVFTNTVPVDAYRGAGRPEAAYIIERMIDMAAYRLKLNTDDIRSRNFITRFPYKTSLGMEIDIADFPGTLARAQQAIDWQGFAARRQASKSRNRLRGIGLSSYLEVTLGIPNDVAEMAFNEDGTLRLIVGSASTGQGHETAYKQLLNIELGIDPETVEFVQGDTARVATGGGHGGSRSLMIVGNAVQKTAINVREKGIAAAAYLFGVSLDDITFEDGLFINPAGNERLSVAELETELRRQTDLPEDVPATLSSKQEYTRERFSYPNGVHAAEIEVDPETGKISLQAYVIVDDFGRILNPLIAGGQAMGGAVQGIGQAMLEAVVYDPDGQQLSGSLMDYALPRAGDICAIHLEFNEDAPTSSNPLGVKGAGEAGATGAPPAIVNALMDALKPLGIEHLDMPLTPLKVWQAITAANK